MLDRDQLAAASAEEAARALRSERQAGLREAARKARQRALRGNTTRAAALRTKYLPLTPQPEEHDPDMPDSGQPSF